MTPYWLLFAVWAIGAVQFARRADRPRSNVLFVFASALTALMIGLRFEVGGDWLTYYRIYEQISFQPLWDGVRLSDPAYALVNWISGQLDWGMWLPNTVCGIAFMAGVARLANRQPNPWLTILVAVPYLIIVVAMGYTRQAAAIGIVCWALADARPDRLWRLVATIFLAALFHKTAILILPIVLVPVFRRNALFGIAGAGMFLILFAYTLLSSSEQFINVYANSDYDSQGAAIRVAMNVVPAVLFLLLGKRMTFTPFLRSYWTFNAWLALASVPALLTVSASSGVDRMALFLIPLQMVVYGQLPYILSRRAAPNPAALIGVLAYSLVVQFVWLNYAVNAQLWMPYLTFLNQPTI